MTHIMNVVVISENFGVSSHSMLRSWLLQKKTSAPRIEKMHLVHCDHYASSESRHKLLLRTLEHFAYEKDVPLLIIVGAGLGFQIDEKAVMEEGYKKVSVAYVFRELERCYEELFGNSGTETGRGPEQNITQDEAQQIRSNEDLALGFT